MKNFVIFAFVLLTVGGVLTDENEDENTLKCIVKFLKEKNVHEDFFDSVSTQIDNGVDCEYLMNVKLTRAYGKINDKLKADSFFAKYAPCIMNAIKTETNKVVVLQREAIKLNGLGVKVWNYFNQKEHLDDLKKKVETSINKAASEKCITAY